VRSGTLVGGPVRKMVLGGTSMTAGVLINYLPAHMVYRTPQMQRIYDGFLPMSNGAMVPRRRRPDDPRPDDARGEREYHE
jgi:hypothetical protein